MPQTYMSIKDFIKQGYLQEVNREYLHPLGLSLGVTVEEDGEAKLYRVWDSRDDPEGMVFGDATDTDKARQVAKQRAAKAVHRAEQFGWTVQPVGVVLSKEDLAGTRGG